MRLLLAFFALCVASVPLARGRLSALTTVQFRWTPALIAALVVQFLILVVFPLSDPVLLGIAHVGTYAMAAAFLAANRHIPGLWLVGLGGAMNLTAITANGGVMPAAASAWAAAGRAVGMGKFTNSGIVEAPRLGFLGDIFAIPAPLPLANVFSAGDVCLLLGGLIVLHRLCGSHLVPSGTRQFTSLRHHPGFLRLWSAQAVSNVGDWTYSLAVVASVAERGSANVLATLLIAQVAPAALTGLLGGPLIDRLHRTRLMVAADVFRAVAVASLLIPAEPSLGHLYAVAALLGLWGAVFQPTLHASLPNLVPKRKLVAANSVVAATYHLAIVVGPVLGGVLFAEFGAAVAFAVNATTFAVSAVLVAGVRLPRQRPASEGPSPTRALVEGLRYVAVTPLARGILATLGLVVFAAAIRTPLEPLFIKDALGREPTALGLVGGAWGFGMLIGSVAAPAAARRWSRERLLWLSIAVVGLSVLAASQARLLSPVVAFWLFAGAGNAMGTIAYETLLQERTPDAFRGRVMAGSEAVIAMAFFIGASLAGPLYDQVGLRGSYALSGLTFLVAAVVGRSMLMGHRRRRTTAPAAAVPA
ncbi:MAG: MFS transporter, partial [Actinomycetota bacterium]|nr:MFS transporter [Actinomycetota bacterium]